MWILAKVVRQERDGLVELHDEDDASRVFVLPRRRVRRLRDLSTELRKVRRANLSSPRAKLRVTAFARFVT